MIFSSFRWRPTKEEVSLLAMSILSLVASTLLPKNPSCLLLILLPQEVLTAAASLLPPLPPLIIPVWKSPATSSRFLSFWTTSHQKNQVLRLLPDWMVLNLLSLLDLMSHLQRLSNCFHLDIHWWSLFRLLRSDFHYSPLTHPHLHTSSF